MIDWTQVLVAAIGAILSYLTIRNGMKTAEVKADVAANTAVTKQAATKAGEANNIAVIAANNTEKMLNGVLDEKIAVVVKAQLEPLHKLHEEHAALDAENMKDIRQAQEASIKRIEALNVHAKNNVDNVAELRRLLAELIEQKKAKS